MSRKEELEERTWATILGSSSMFLETLSSPLLSFDKHTLRCLSNVCLLVLYILFSFLEIVMLISPPK